MPNFVNEAYSRIKIIQESEEVSIEEEVYNYFWSIK